MRLKKKLKETIDFFNSSLNLEALTGLCEYSTKCTGKQPFET